MINDKGNRMLINSQTNNNLHDKWLKILKSFDGLTITKDKLYELYYDFYDENKKEGTYVRLPERNELNQELNESLIVEYYNR